MNFLSVVILFSLCILNAVVAEWNMTQANIAVWLSAAADCGHENYESHVFQGPTTGFVVTHTIWDFKATEGYVGYLSSENAIYVVFRGTSSVKNYITDILFVKTPYTTYPECNAMVYLGFFNAVQTVAPQVLDAVLKLKLQFPNYEVRVAGHSLGAGLAQLMSMDLIKKGVNITTLHTWGQPRTGTKEFSDCAAAKMTGETFRVVHYQDNVPHWPFQIQGYYHVCTEIYEDEDHQVRVCDDTCEDPTCSNQWKLKEVLNTNDHVVYLGLPLMCSAVSR